MEIIGDKRRHAYGYDQCKKNGFFGIPEQPVSLFLRIVFFFSRKADKKDRGERQLERKAEEHSGVPQHKQKSGKKKGIQPGTLSSQKKACEEKADHDKRSDGRGRRPGKAEVEDHDGKAEQGSGLGGSKINGQSLEKALRQPLYQPDEGAEQHRRKKAEVCARNT